MNPDATMNSNALQYQGMSREMCREELLKDLEKANLLISVEPMTHSVGHSERTGVMVEPYLSKQWFVKMGDLSKHVLETQAKKDEKVNFVPERFEKILNHWMEISYDWCISRQLWWGHRIPAWYKDDEIYVGMDAPEGEGWVQDNDVLDTWFSSALWPFSTLGWPEKTEDMERFYPNDVLVTAYDIIFFWVARMAIQSKHFMKKRPFKKCFIHGLIRDEQGRKMSKSLGNGVDPFDLIAKYGCDAMRYFLTTNATPGQDLRYSEEKMASSWNYINKIWNISRFIQMNLNNCNYEGQEIDTKNLLSIDKWILTKMTSLIENVNTLYDNFELGEVAKAIYNFTWDDLASWYLELTKVTFSTGTKEQQINTCAVLKEVLTTVIKLLHPFMPFVTEEIYMHFHDGSIVVSDWPKANKEYSFSGTENMNDLTEVITAVRNIRNEKNVALSKKIQIGLESKNSQVESFLKEHSEYLKRFCNPELLTIEQNINDEDASIAVLTNVKVIIPLKELINYEEEEKRLTALKGKLEGEVERCEKMLNNPNFVSKAPAQKIEAEKAKLQNYKFQLEEVCSLLAKLK